MCKQELVLKWTVIIPYDSTLHEMLQSSEVLGKLSIDFFPERWETIFEVEIFCDTDI